MQFDNKELWEEYMRGAKETSPAYYEDCRLILSRAKRGDALAKNLVTTVLCFMKLGIIEREFYLQIASCADVHARYGAELEALKQCFWGRSLEFNALVDGKNKQYTSLYKTAMGLKKDFIDISKERILAFKRIYRGGKNVNCEHNPFVIKYDDMDENDAQSLNEYAGVTNAEAVKIEEERLADKAKNMEKYIAKTRANLNGDIEDSKVAKSAVLASVPSASRE